MPIISRTTIDADTPLPTCHDATLVLEIPITSYDGPIEPELARYLELALHDWCDGRYPFHVEMLKAGLHDCIKSAAGEIVCGRMQAKYGREMVASDDGRGETARWHLEAQKEKPVIPYMREDIKVRIEPCE